MQINNVSFVCDGYGALKCVDISLFDTEDEHDSLVTHTISTIREFFKGIVEVRGVWGRTPSDPDRFSPYVSIYLHTTNLHIAHKCIEVWGNPGQKVPERKEYPVSMTNKLLWRYILCYLFPDGTGTPVRVTKQEHLNELKSILNRLDDFTTDTEVSERFFYGGVSKQHLKPHLETLIQAVEHNGYCSVID
jgi:hypothetical protein